MITAIIRPVLFEEGQSFEHLAQSMVERGTILGLKIPIAEQADALVKYARRLDRNKPTFVKSPRLFRSAYAQHLRTVVRSLERNPITVSRAVLTKTADWLDREVGGELYQSELWRFWEKSVDRRSQPYLKRVSDTCYFLAQGEALGVSHLSTDDRGARVIEALSVADGAQLTVGRGQRVEKATSKFPMSASLKLSFPEIATLRRHEAFGYLRKELHKLTKGKTSLDGVSNQNN